MPGYGDPPIKTQFKKGQSGNPSGIAKDFIAPIVLKRYTRQQIAEALSRLFELTLGDLKAISVNQATPALEQIIARALIRAAAKGKFSDIDRLLDRCIGKVSQDVEGDRLGFGHIPLPEPIIIFTSVARLEKPGLP